MNASDQENLNSTIGIPGELLAKLHLFYRSSVIGRRDISKKLLKDIKTIDDFEYSDEFSNRNVEIFQALLKTMGLKLVIDKGDEILFDFHSKDVEQYAIGDEIIFSTHDEYKEESLRAGVEEKYKKKEKFFFGTDEEYEEIIRREVRDVKNSQEDEEGNITFDFD